MLALDATVSFRLASVKPNQPPASMLHTLPSHSLAHLLLLVLGGVRQDTLSF
jgi:hypothetical protein